MAEQELRQHLFQVYRFEPVADLPAPRGGQIVIVTYTPDFGEEQIVLVTDGIHTIRELYETWLKNSREVHHDDTLTGKGTVSDPLSAIPWARLKLDGDGENTEFDLPGDFVYALLSAVQINGLSQDPEADYIIDVGQKKIIFAEAPETGDRVYVFYRSKTDGEDEGGEDEDGEETNEEAEGGEEMNGEENGEDNQTAD